MSNVDRCICCGEIIPEGRQICPICESDPTNIKPNTEVKGVVHSK